MVYDPTTADDDHNMHRTESALEKHKKLIENAQKSNKQQILTPKTRNQLL